MNEALKDKAVADLIDAARYTLTLLENLSTEQFSLGADRPARVLLASALSQLVELDSDRAVEYGVG